MRQGLAKFLAMRDLLHVSVNDSHAGEPHLTSWAVVKSSIMTIYHTVTTLPQGVSTKELQHPTKSLRLAV
jgi:hypothetical protein